MRILFMLNDLNAGGAERLALRLSRAAVERGHTVRIITAFEPGTLGPEVDPRVELHCLGHGPGQLLRTVWRCRRDMRKFRPDVFLGALAYGNRIGAFVARTLRVPVITIRLTGVLWYMGRRQEVADRFCFRFADVGIACGDAVRVFFRDQWHFPAEKLVVIRNPMALPAVPAHASAERAAVRAELGLAPDQLAFLTCGRLDPIKGQAHLIEAAALLAPRFPALRWFIAGDGPLAGELRALAQARSLGDRLVFLGFRNDVLRLLQGADVFVLPSLSEAMPVAGLEAAAAGLPIIGSDSDGIPEIVSVGQSGWLVPPADPEALAEAMGEASRTSVQDRIHMGEAGRALVAEKHQFEMVMEQYLQLWRSLAARRGQRIE